MTSAATKTEKTVEEIAARAGEIEQDLEELEGQRDRALAESERISLRLEALNEPRVTLSPKAFRGDKDASKRLEELEDQAETLSRRLRLILAQLHVHRDWLKDTFSRWLR